MNNNLIDKVAYIRKFAETPKDFKAIGAQGKEKGLEIWDKMKEFGGKAAEQGGKALEWAQDNPIASGAAIGSIPAIAIALASKKGKRLKRFLWSLAAGVPLGIGGMYAWNTWGAPNFTEEAKAARAARKEDQRAVKEQAKAYEESGDDAGMNPPPKDQQYPSENY